MSDNPNERIVSGGRRPDGTHRKPIRVRPGYASEELGDTKSYVSRGSKIQRFRDNYVPGAGMNKTAIMHDVESGGDGSAKSSKTQPKKQSRRSRRNKQPATTDSEEKCPSGAATVNVDKLKRKLAKKLREIEALEGRADAELTPEQIAKIARKQDILNELSRYNST